MNAYERFALDHYLNDYDGNMSFDEVLEALTDGDESVTIWQPFEDEPIYLIIEHINGLIINLENRFTPKQVTP